MNQQIQTQFSSQKQIKFLTQTIKKVLVQKGINPSTRQGNKELALLVSKLSQEPFSNLEQAKKVGEKLGEAIVEISQQKDKKYLDKEVIRQISLQNKIPSLAEFSPKDKDSASLEVAKPTRKELTSAELTPKGEQSQPNTQSTEELTPQKDATPMSLKERLAEDIKVAMKAKDKIRLETVRSIKKALIEKEVAVRPSGQDSLTEEQEIELLAQQAKQRRDSIEQYRQARRDDLADKETQELAIIETYFPSSCLMED